MKNKIISDFGIFYKNYLRTFEGTDENDPFERQKNSTRSSEPSIKEIGGVFTERINWMLKEYEGEETGNIRDTLFRIGKEHIKSIAEKS